MTVYIYVIILTEICFCGNELFDSIKCRRFIDNLSNY
jgi:SAM-dependent MidA family methyltransferase